VESNPYTWWVSWAVANRCTFLLPHDKSYFAIRHFGVRAGLLLDVGANTGISALSFLRLEPRLRILSLEPNPIHTRALKTLKRKLGSAFDYQMLALGEAASEIQFVTPVFRWIALHTFTSGDEQRVRDGVRRVFGERVAQRCRFVRSRAPVILLDALEVNPVVIKIDAEGFDLAVLRGARATLARCRPCVLVEIVGDAREFFDLFAALHYRLFSFDFGSDSFAEVDLTHCGDSTGERNYWAVPQERAANLPGVGERRASPESDAGDRLAASR
jgi:FkbM family methyltransferase